MDIQGKYCGNLDCDDGSGSGGKDWKVAGFTGKIMSSAWDCCGWNTRVMPSGDEERVIAYKRSLNGDVDVRVFATELITKAVVRDELPRGRLYMERKKEPPPSLEEPQDI